ncbi:MAG: hypothetical protein JWL93_2733 [Hyphomicrobiales bacterium]|nr:hypothetical protein [Hyphomicrobiales bacterium]
MSASNFDACLRLTLRHEGGYADHPDDPGGATNLGVTRATLAAWRGHGVRREDVRALERTEAGAIYRRLYWDEVRGDDLPAGLDAVMFDHAVNSGPRAAVVALQKSLRVTVDGRLGPATLRAARAAHTKILIGDLCARRRRFLARLKTFRSFGRGWTRRVADVESRALIMAA